MNSKLKKNIFKGLVTAALLFSFLIFLGPIYYNVSMKDFAESLVRVVSTPMLSKYYRHDNDYVHSEVASYYRGITIPENTNFQKENWVSFSGKYPGFSIIGKNSIIYSSVIPFVYQKPTSEHLVKLRHRYRLDEIVGDGTEYVRMLRLFNWLGTRFDHGMDPVPGGNTFFDPVDVVEAGEQGGRFWCETAARLTVHSATAMGWPARLLTASRDGYHWNHALAEIWSNQFNKWFLVDADYNILYESNGIPLSGFELCHKGRELMVENKIGIRHFAPSQKRLARG